VKRFIRHHLVLRTTIAALLAVALSSSLVASAQNAPREADRAKDGAPRDRKAGDPAAQLPDEALIAPAANAFLQAVAAKEDDAAREHTTAAYREAHPGEDFRKVLDGLRTIQFDPGKQPLQVRVGPPRAADDGPRQALAMLPSKSNGEPVTIGMVLSFERGAWRIDALEPIAAIDTGRGGFVRDFHRANPGSQPAAFAGPGRMGLRGRLTKVDDRSVTIERPAEATGAAGPTERTLTVDAETQVRVYVQNGERAMPSGVTVPRFVSAPAKLSDLKVGDPVIVEVPIGQENAVRIAVQPPLTTVRIQRPARQP